mmetsp:Transcript_5659/g.10560  ORF Transcript_5659/g.10560 Transcript_5659/m.10560 type:complete len:366 (+) Transcript_5659:53-1150(+)
MKSSNSSSLSRIASRLLTSPQSIGGGILAKKMPRGVSTPSSSGRILLVSLDTNEYYRYDGNMNQKRHVTTTTATIGSGAIGNSLVFVGDCGAAYNKFMQQPRQQHNPPRRFQSTMPDPASMEDDDFEDDDEDELVEEAQNQPVEEKEESVNPTLQQPDQPQDYFAIFDVPHTYDLNLQLLKDRYLALMTLYHPDKQGHGQTPPPQHPQQLYSANDITNAYQILRDDHTRACHLLELLGRPILEDKNSSTGESSSDLVGMDFLMDMMEWRERIETLALCSKTSDDSGPCSCGSHDKDKELKDIWNETQAYQRDCENELKRLWKQDKGGGDGKFNIRDEDIPLARKLTAQLQYWHRLETALRDEIDV